MLILSTPNFNKIIGHGFRIIQGILWIYLLNFEWYFYFLFFRWDFEIWTTNKPFLKPECPNFSIFYPIYRDGCNLVKSEPRPIATTSLEIFF